MINNTANNGRMPLLTSLLARWHEDRNLIKGSTIPAQTSKLFEEFTEVVAAQHPTKSPEFVYDTIVAMLDDLLARGRIKTVAEDDAAHAFKDGLGDMFVVQVNLAEQAELTMAQCVEASYDEIKNRKGKKVKGVFVKEDDLGDLYQTTGGDIYRKVLNENNHKHWWYVKHNDGWQVISGEPLCEVFPL